MMTPPPQQYHKPLAETGSFLMNSPRDHYKVRHIGELSRLNQRAPLYLMRHQEHCTYLSFQSHEVAQLRAALASRAGMIAGPCGLDYLCWDRLGRRSARFLGLIGRRSLECL